jgi:hypothetical protein
VVVEDNLDSLSYFRPPIMDILGKCSMKMEHSRYAAIMYAALVKMDATSSPLENLFCE